VTRVPKKRQCKFLVGLYLRSGSAYGAASSPGYLSGPSTIASAALALISQVSSLAGDHLRNLMVMSAQGPQPRGQSAGMGYNRGDFCRYGRPGDHLVYLTQNPKLTGVFLHVRLAALSSNFLTREEIVNVRDSRNHDSRPKARALRGHKEPFDGQQFRRIRRAVRVPGQH
jgi:hypothetical protein